LNSYILKNVENNPYLGLIISKDLKWATHIDQIAKKSSSTLGFVQRNLKKCPEKCKRTAYISLVRSTLEYGATIWDPHLEKDIYKLEKVQRKAARFIKNDYKSNHPGAVTQMLNDLDLPPLQSRRREKRLCFLYKISKGTVPAIDPNTYLKPIENKRRIKAKNYPDCVTNNIVQKHQNTHSKCFQLPPSNNTEYRNSFFPRTIVDWNQLGDVIVSADSVDTFKSLLA